MQITASTHRQFPNSPLAYDQPLPALLDKLNHPSSFDFGLKSIAEKSKRAPLSPCDFKNIGRRIAHHFNHPENKKATTDSLLSFINDSQNIEFNSQLLVSLITHVMDGGYHKINLEEMLHIFGPHLISMGRFSDLLTACEEAEEDTTTVAFVNFISSYITEEKIKTTFSENHLMQQLTFFANNEDLPSRQYHALSQESLSFKEFFFLNIAEKLSSDDPTSIHTILEIEKILSNKFNFPRKSLDPHGFCNRLNKLIETSLYKFQKNLHQQLTDFHDSKNGLFFFQKFKDMDQKVSEILESSQITNKKNALYEALLPLKHVFGLSVSQIQALILSLLEKKTCPVLLESVQPSMWAILPCSHTLSFSAMETSMILSEHPTSCSLCRHDSSVGHNLELSRHILQRSHGDEAKNIFETLSEASKIRIRSIKMHTVKLLLESEFYFKFKQTLSSYYQPTHIHPEVTLPREVELHAVLSKKNSSMDYQKCLQTLYAAADLKNLSQFYFVLENILNSLTITDQHLQFSDMFFMSKLITDPISRISLNTHLITTFIQSLDKNTESCTSISILSEMIKTIVDFSDTDKEREYLLHVFSKKLTQCTLGEVYAEKLLCLPREDYAPFHLIFYQWIIIYSNPHFFDSYDDKTKESLCALSLHYKNFNLSQQIINSISDPSLKFSLYQRKLKKLCQFGEYSEALKNIIIEDYESLCHLLPESSESSNTDNLIIEMIVLLIANNNYELSEHFLDKLTNISLKPGIIAKIIETFECTLKSGVKKCMYGLPHKSLEATMDRGLVLKKILEWHELINNYHIESLYGISDKILDAYISSEEIQKDPDVIRKVLLYQCYTSEERYNENFSKLLNTISMSDESAVIELIKLLFVYKNEAHIFSLVEKISDEKIKLDILECVLINAHTFIHKENLLKITEDIKNDSPIIRLKKAWIYMFYEDHDSAKIQLSTITSDDLISTETSQSLPFLLHSFSKMELNTLKTYAPFISKIYSTICYADSLTPISNSINDFFTQPIPFQVLLEDILKPDHILEEEGQIKGNHLLPLFVIKQIVTHIYTKDSFDLSNEIKKKIEIIIKILQKNTHIFTSDTIIPYFLFLENHGSLDSEHLKSFFRNISDSETKTKTECIALYLNNFLEKAKKTTQPLEFFEQKKPIIECMIAHLNIQDDTLSNFLFVFLDVFCEIIDTDKTFSVYNFFHKKLFENDREDPYQSFLRHIIPIIFKKDDFENHLDILIRNSDERFHKDIFNNFMEVFFHAFENSDNIFESELLVQNIKHILIRFFNLHVNDFSDIITQCALHVSYHISIKESKSSIHDSLDIINHLTVFVSQLPEDLQDAILEKLFNSNFIHFFKFCVSDDSDSSAFEAIRKRNDFISRVNDRLRVSD